MLWTPYSLQSAPVIWVSCVVTFSDSRDIDMYWCIIIQVGEK